MVRAGVVVSDPGPDGAADAAGRVAHEGVVVAACVACHYTLAFAHDTVGAAARSAAGVTVAAAAVVAAAVV